MKKFIIGFLILLIASRFIGLDWGMPFPMHPDERNMVLAVQRLDCQFSLASLFTQGIWETASECYDPQFYAYGQPPLYVAGLISWAISHIGFESIPDHVLATLALRFNSAIASVLNAVVLIALIRDFFPSVWKKISSRTSALIIFIFSPYFIQFSHFGTTESLLMLLFSLIIYVSLKIIDAKDPKRWILISAIISGFAVAVKVSALMFAAVPVLAVAYVFIFRNASLSARKKFKWLILYGSGFTCVAVLTSLIFSPHYVLSWKDAWSSLNYEISVGNGSYKAFYTRSFEYSQPILFHIFRIFPYVLGLMQSILFVVGFFSSSWKNARANLLRCALVIVFLPTAFLYAKWARFSSPIFPVMSVFAVLGFHAVINLLPRTIVKKIIIIAILTCLMLPGLAYLSIYTHPDVRFTASNWMYEELPAGSVILSETANVIDLPIPNPYLKHDQTQIGVISFDYYNVQNDPNLQSQFVAAIDAAEYVVIPSRRVFANHTCVDLFDYANGSRDVALLGYSDEKCTSHEYPFVEDYYQRVTQSSEFGEVARFTSFPRLSVFGKTILEFPDEKAEETWTVFDHPVVRVYKRTQ